MVTTKSNSLYLIKKDFDDSSFTLEPVKLFSENESIIQCVAESKSEMFVFYITRSTSVK